MMDITDKQIEELAMQDKYWGKLNNFRWEQFGRDLVELTRQQLTKPADEVLIEALREIMYMGLDNAAGTDRGYFCESQLRLCIAKAAIALEEYKAKPADDTITVSKEEWEEVSKDAERWKIARTLGVAVVNDKGNITGAHFNEGADQRVDKAIQGESE
jgi:hypothetical protein